MLAFHSASERGAVKKSLLLLLLPALLGALAASPDRQSLEAPDELVVDGKVVGRRVEARPDDICLVCRERVVSNGVCYLVRGQRVAVHQRHEQDLLARVQYWLAQIQPRVALFSVDQGRSSLSGVWFFAGLYVLTGLVFASATAHLAVRKAMPPIPWFFAGLFLNAAGYLILLPRAPGDAHAFPAGIPAGLRKVPLTRDAIECPRCGTPLHPAAHNCSGCGDELAPAVESETDRWRKQRNQ